MFLKMFSRVSSRITAENGIESLRDSSPNTVVLNKLIKQTNKSIVL